MQGVRWDAGQEWVKGSCLETWPKYNSGGLLQGQGGCQVCSYLLKGDGSPVCPTKGSLRGEEALLGGCEESARQGQMPTARGIQDKVMVRMGVCGGRFHLSCTDTLCHLPPTPTSPRWLVD